MKQASESYAHSADRNSALRDFTRIFVIAAAYFLAHWVAFFFPDSKEGIMLIWPAGGIALAAFLMNPRRLWPGLIAAFYVSGIVANVYVGGRSFAAGFGYMTGNMVESVGCALLILTWSGEFRRFTRLGEVLTLIAGAVGVNAVSACIGAGTSAITRGASFVDAWQSWYVSDGLGILVIAPLIVVWLRKGTDAIGRLRLKDTMEFIACMFVWSFFSAAIFYPLNMTARIHLHPYILVALLVWPAVRLGPRGVTLALLLLFLIVVGIPQLPGGSPFSHALNEDVNMNHRLLEMQLFLGFLSAVGYMMTAGYASLKKAEEGVLKSNKQYDDLAAHISVGIYLLHSSPDGALKFEYVSPRIAQILGVDSESILADANAAFRTIHPDDLPALRELNRRHIQDRTPFDWEGRALVDGNVIWLHITSTPQPSDDGGSIWNGIVENITERIKARQLLQSSEERFRAIWDKSFDGMRLVDSNGITVMVNNAFCGQMGKAREELENRPLDVVYDSENGKRIMAAAVERFRNKSIVPHLESLVTLWDGRKKWFELSNSIIELGSGSQYLLSIFRDISERKKAEEGLRLSEERLKKAQQRAHVGSWEWNVKTNRLEWSDEMFRIFGLEKETFNGSLPDVMAGAIHPEDRTKVEASDRSLRQERKLVPLEYRIIWPDQSIHTVWSEKSEIQFDEAGNPAILSGYLQDITARKQAEQASTDALNYSDTIFEASPIGIMTFKETGEVISANRAAAMMFGVTVDQLLAQNFRNVVSWKQSGLLDAATATLATGDEKDIEIFHQSIFNKDLWLSARLVPFMHQGQKELLTLFYDVTEKKRAEEALRESEEMLRAMFEASQDAIGVSKNAVHIYVNTSYLKLFGLEGKGSVVGTSIFDHIAPSHRQRLIESEQRRARGEAVESAYEMRGIKADGTEFDAEVHVSTYALNGEIYSLGVIRDITDRKRAEDALQFERTLLRTIIDNIPDSIYSKDISCRKILANLADVRNSGVNSEADLLGKDDFELYPEELAEKFYADDQYVMRTGQPLLEKEEYLLDEKGEKRWFVTSKLPLRDSEGGIVGLVGVGRDITARRKTEKALRENQELFSAFMSHSPVYMYIKEVTPTASRLLQASDNFVEMIGIPAPKMIGRTMVELFPPEFAAKMIADDRAVVSGGHVLQQDEELNGRHYTTIKFPIILGDRTLLAGYTIDITARQKAEEELRESEERFRSIYENSTIGLYRTSPDGRIILANPTLVRKLGYTSFEELERRNLEREGFEPSYERSQFVKQVEMNGGVNGLEAAWTRRDGSIIHVRESARVIRDLNGKSLYFDGTVEDITERKEAEERLRESEERYRSLFENAPVGVFYSTTTGKIVRVNAEYSRIFGYLSPSEVKDDVNSSTSASAIYLHPGERRKLVAEAGVSPGKWIRAETQLRRRDGSSITANLTMRVLPDNTEQLEGFIEDITERKQAEMALRESENRFKSIFENSPAGVALVGMDGRYLEVNQALSRIYGYAAEELLNDGFLKITDPSDVEASRQIQQRILESKGKALRFTKRYVHKDGHTILAEINSSSIDDAAGTPMYFITHVNDITERKQQEEKAARLSAIVESSDDIIISKTLDGIITSWNRGAEKVYGYTETEMVGQPISRLLPPEITDELPLIFQRVKVGEHVEHYETIRRRKDGQHIDVSLTISPIRNTDGVIIGASTIGRGITERKKAELKLRQALADAQRFQEALDYVPAYIYMKDSQSRYIYANQPTLKLFGCTAQELVGADDSRFFPPETVQRLLEIEARVFMGEQTMEEVETIDKRDERHVFWEIKTPIYFDPEKKVIWGLLGISTDITERINEEEALRRAQKLESIGTLAGGIAHDFNNLLNAMLGQSTLAIGKLPNESPARYHIEKSIQAADRAADLTRQLLAYSGKGKFLTEEFDLNKLVEENAQLLRVSVPKTTQLRYQLDSSALNIHGDVGQIQQVIMNLIINAGEAMGPNPGYITVRTGRIELTEDDIEFWKFTNIPLQPGSYALFRVDDTGHGMSSEVLGRIFDPFFTTKFTGRGLGLAAVLGIIRGHKGGVRIVSEEGMGTSFEIIFPLLVTTTTNKVEKMGRESVIDGAGRTVLVIDDESFVLDLLTDVFTDAHFTVLQSLNPVEGIELYRKHQQEIVVVILDYSMPGMDGKAAFDELVKINKEVAVLLCSGYTEEEIKSAFGDSRPLGFIKKPYRPSELLLQVSSLLK